MNIKKIFFLYILLSLLSFNYAENIDFNSFIDDIQIIGLNSKKTKESIQALSLETKPKHFLKASELSNDIKKIYTTGFFSSIKAESITSDNMHVLTIVCKENEVIKHLQVHTSHKKINKLIYSTFSSEINSPFNSLSLNQKKDHITQTLKEKGFDFFNISSIDFNKKTNTLIINTLEGKIESIQFSGLHKIDRRIIIREFSQQPGKVFNSKDIRKDREKVLRLGYFSHISNPTFEKSSNPNKINILFSVIEKKSNRIIMGVEQDQNKYIGFISSIRNHNIIKSDLLSLKTQMEYKNDSLNFNSYIINYTQPWLFNRYNLNTSVSYYDKEKQEIIDNDITASNRTGASLSVTVPLSRNFSTTTSLKKESVSQINSEDNIPDYDLNSIEINIKYSSILNYNNPKKGNSIEFTYEKGGPLGPIDLGGLSFSQVSSSASTFKSLSSSTVLALRVQAGIYYPNKDIDKSFENEYFIIGGSTSIRGYNELQSPFSGIRKCVINTEIRYNWTPTIQSILFYDIGNAFDSSLNLNELHIGYGTGFRYITPLGPIRFDFAKGDRDIFIHFGLGQLF
ncbi:hypothetical protein DID78_04985 [Candidatus Marinamargulisbacteria bacterium SCGC AG-343-D04]|nr:hypothetical protein DID78_04985 [Candidatus Marinamargulisbacteria bacterium SCGC AG-343-D04]